MSDSSFISGVGTLVKNNPSSPMNLADISATNTNLSISNGTPANGGETVLWEGSITRIGEKAYCNLQLSVDDGSRIVLTFGTSIIPAGAEILSVDAVADITDADNVNLRREGQTQISFDRTGTTDETVISFSFWVDGYPDFIDYELV